MSKVKKITKVLSANDAGVNSAKGHGVLIPKNVAFQSFFPRLDSSKDNPSTTFVCRDAVNDQAVELTYRYYNKTKNEYRITGITKYLHANHAVPGSRLSLSKTDAGDYIIELAAPAVQDEDLPNTAGNVFSPESEPNEAGTSGEPEPSLNARQKKRLGIELVFAIIGEWEVVSD